jgi:hypothetical protein
MPLQRVLDVRFERTQRLTVKVTWLRMPAPPFGSRL